MPSKPCHEIPNHVCSVFRHCNRPVLLQPVVLPGHIIAKQVLAHLEAETAYAKAALADTEALQGELYRELRGRIQVPHA